MNMQKTMLALGLALIGAGAQAQTLTAAVTASTPPVLTPGIAGVVVAGTPVQLVKEGFTGTEGPIAAPDGSFLFTETQANRITRIAADGSTSVFLENTNGANGLAFAPGGELIAVQVAETRVGVIYPADKKKTLVDRFEGKSFSRPNDLVLDRRGNVYFTDSGPGAGVALKPDFAVPAVYRISPDGQLTRIAADIERPNGIQLSPDEKVLYVANTAGEHVLAYDVAADGRIGAKRNFAKLAGFRTLENGSTSSGADGLAVDASGRLYVASSAGVEVFDAQGQALGVIALPKAPQNLAFAGADKKTLNIVGRGAAWRVAVLTPGYAGRAK
jgi:gluconolactonase